MFPMPLLWHSFSSKLIIWGWDFCTVFQNSPSMYFLSLSLLRSEWSTSVTLSPSPDSVFYTVQSAGKTFHWGFCLARWAFSSQHFSVSLFFGTSFSIEFYFGVSYWLIVPFCSLFSFFWSTFWSQLSTVMTILLNSLSGSPSKPFILTEDHYYGLGIFGGDMLSWFSVLFLFLCYDLCIWN